MAKVLSKEEITAELVGLNEWTWHDDRLKKSFNFAGFREAMSFLVRISFEAEEQNHHPEISNCYNRVELALNTHDVGGKVTTKDFDLAQAIEKITFS
jgi:4a-hydroxytetrahydrobiopterin dehydratase